MFSRMPQAMSLHRYRADTSRTRDSFVNPAKSVWSQRCAVLNGGRLTGSSG